MAIPHVFHRSRRAMAGPYREPSDERTVARLIAGQLGTLLDKAEGAGLIKLSSLLELARIEAEALVAGQREKSDGPAPILAPPAEGEP